MNNYLIVNTDFDTILEEGRVLGERVFVENKRLYISSLMILSM